MAGTQIAIKVKTEKLTSTANEVEAKIRNLEGVFRNVDSKIKSSRSYWVGDGVEAWIKGYQAKSDVINQAFTRFRENVTDLRTIAGVYEQAERDAVATNNALKVDEIV